MPLIPALEKYFDALEKNNVSSEELQELKECATGNINEYTDIDDLEEAKNLLKKYIRYGQDAGENYSNQYLKDLAKNMVKGSVTGAGIGFFTGKPACMSVLGALVGLEISGLKFQFQMRIIQNVAKELNDMLNQTLEMVRESPSPMH